MKTFNQDLIVIPKGLVNELITAVNDNTACVEGLKTQIGYISKKTKNPQVLTISDICQILNISRTDLLTKKPYLLPDFGEKRNNKRRMRYNFNDFFAWFDKPEEEKQQAYQDYLEAKRLESIKRSTI